jgi:hypothetical protein
MSSLQNPPPEVHDSFCACFGGKNILICKKSWREYEELTLQDQQQVWADLSGKPARGRNQQQPAGAVGAAMMPPTSAQTTTAIEEEPFPPSFLSSLNILPPGAGKAFIQKSVEALREELYRMQLHSGRKRTGGDSKNDPKQALLLAMSQNPAYVTDHDFLLKFLRCEHFETLGAAQRMACHFQEKHLLFPEEALTRDIRLDDLSDDDMDALQRGYLQILKKPDHIGRPVMFYYKALSNCYKQRENIVRFYLNLQVGV